MVTVKADAYGKRRPLRILGRTPKVKIGPQRHGGKWLKSVRERKKFKELEG
jgi:hypothetical protein